MESGVSDGVATTKGKEMEQREGGGEGKPKTVVWPFQVKEFWAKFEELMKEEVTDVEGLVALLRDVWEAKKLHATHHSTSSSRHGAPKSESLASMLAEWKEKRKELYDEVFAALPRIQRLALKFPLLFDEEERPPTPQLLAGDRNTVVVLSQEACACVVANAFFGTLLSPASYIDSEAAQPAVHFHTWFGSDYCIPYTLAILHYLVRVSAEMPSGKVSFRRVVVTPGEVPDWAGSELPVAKAIVQDEGTIEDSGAALQADFANEYIGGGLIRGARAQEEILFCFRPECLVSLCLFSVMQPNEAIVIRGAERFSTFRGYGGGLAFAGDYVDQTPVDAEGFRQVEIVCFDAVVAFYVNQYSRASVDRDLLKAYAAFTRKHSALPGLPGDIATGNWGCGAFGGDKRLKFLEQLIAASQAERTMHYFTFGEREFSASLRDLLPRLEDGNLTVGKLYRALISVIESPGPRSRSLSKVDLFALLVHRLDQQ